MLSTHSEWPPYSVLSFHMTCKKVLEFGCVDILLLCLGFVCFV